MVLTFVIPVRHPATVDDWPAARERMTQTLRSVSAQSWSGWRCVIAANTGTDLPPLPRNVEVTWVDFPPAVMPKVIGGNKEPLYQAVRRDKGARIVAALRHTKPSGHVMVVDYDDLVSNRLAAFCHGYPSAPGWYFNVGYAFDEGRLVLRKQGFHLYCGTSHMVRADLFGSPDDWTNEPFVMRRIGSHIFIDQDLAEAGTPLAPLPFPGAMYRVGYGGNVSGVRGVMGEAFPRRFRKKPLKLARNALNLRWLSRQLEAEFLG